jgi:starch synthase
MEQTKVLFVTQDMTPYTALSEIAAIARELPQYAQEQGMEIRVLMPRFGTINERRHRLHEVVRLSGINIIIDDDDYPLIIKVASLPGARIQVYFLDNDDFFKRKGIFEDKDRHFYEDNGERMIFFSKGVLETVRKFGWAPDVIHCQGWMTSLIPFYLKKAYSTDPIFKDSKVVYSVFNNTLTASVSDNFVQKATAINKGIEGEDMGPYAVRSIDALDLGAITFSDGVVLAGSQVNPETAQAAKAINKPLLELNGERDLAQYKAFYEQLLGK